MSQPIIEVDGISKLYHLGAIGAGSLRESFQRWWRRGPSEAAGTGANEFWALRDVSFDVRPGEVVGVIGRNGAGKSTILKILSRITEPTSGRALIHGRIASLLEVGTGFHPDLSGRENIFLNGAILGMTRAEIRSKFDEMVAFAEVEKFIDTPVKHYSSGMYVRLAFAVAAHLEPEVLIVDEVLAVGDVEFQKKCLGKMGEISRAGRTILFVSHNLSAVATLCSRAILLAGGKVVADGEAVPTIEQYRSIGANTGAEVSWPDPEGAPGNAKVRLKAARIVSGGKTSPDVPIDQDCRIEIDYWNLSPGLSLSVSIHLLDRLGAEILASVNWKSANSSDDEWFGKPLPAGQFRTTCDLPKNFLNEGRYSVRVLLLSSLTRLEFSAGELISFNVHDTGEMRKEYLGSWIGMVRPKLPWHTIRIG